MNTTYKNYLIGSVRQITECTEIILFNKSKITERISLYNLEEFYLKYLTSSNGGLEYTRLTRQVGEDFEYKKSLENGFDVIVYISSVSNSPIGFTEFINEQGIGLSIGITLNISRTLSGELEIVIQNRLSQKNLQKEWIGNQLYNYTTIGKVRERSYKNVFTSNLGRINKDSYSFILGSSTVTTREGSYKLDIRRNITINSLGNYGIFYYRGDLVLGEWKKQEYKLYSLVGTNDYSGSTEYDIYRVMGRYYKDVNGKLRDLENSVEVIGTGKYRFCDFQDPKCLIYDLPTFYTKSNVFKYIPEINNIYLDLDNYLKSNQLMICGKIGSWFILKRNYGGIYIYVASSSTSVLIMTEEDLGKALFVNDQTVILKEEDYYVLYKSEFETLYTERSRVILLGGRLDYIGGTPVLMCFLDTEEDETHYEEYYESGKVNIIFNYENIQGTALNGYRRSYCPGIYGIPELIGSYGSLIFYKIGNTVNYL